MRGLIPGIFTAIAVGWGSADAADWRGTYEPFSRACERDQIRVNTKTLRYGSCVHSIVETLTSTNDELAVLVRSESGCGWSGWVVSLKKASGSEAIDFRGYRSPADWTAGRDQAYCAYGARQPPKQRRQEATPEPELLNVE